MISTKNGQRKRAMLHAVHCAKCFHGFTSSLGLSIVLRGKLLSYSSHFTDEESEALRVIQLPLVGDRILKWTF